VAFNRNPVFVLPYIRRPKPEVVDASPLRFECMLSVTHVQCVLLPGLDALKLKHDHGDFDIMYHGLEPNMVTTSLHHKDNALVPHNF